MLGLKSLCCWGGHEFKADEVEPLAQQTSFETLEGMVCSTIGMPNRGATWVNVHYGRSGLQDEMFHEIQERYEVDILSGASRISCFVWSSRDDEAVLLHNEGKFDVHE